MATPVTDALLNDGALFIPFTDLAAGRLRRNADGSLWLRVHVPLKRSLLNFFGGGQATYHEGNVNGGVVFPQLDTRDARWYRIFSTGIRLGD